MSTWWIDEPSVLGSGNPTDAELGTLRAKGFSVLVSLLDENEQRPRYDLKRAKALGYARHSIPVRDCQPPTVGQLFEFRKLMESLSPGSKVLVHCQAGKGRTGTMAAAYWICKGLTPDSAIERVRKAEPQAVETAKQEEVLREFARQDHKARRWIPEAQQE